MSPGVLVVSAVAYAIATRGVSLEQDALGDIHRQVAADAVAQYGIAKRNGTAIDSCANASATAVAFLQAKDEPAYAKWKAIEKADCAKAGLVLP